MKIRTNNVPRKILLWDELTKKEKGEFDYMDAEQQEEALFVRYKRWAYSLDEFVHIPFEHNSNSEWHEWDGYTSETAFSGMLFRWANKYGDECVLGTFTYWVNSY